MGLGPTATVGFQGPDGEWIPVSPTNALPVQGSGTGGGGNTVPLTQAEYDALTTKDPDVLYVIVG